MSDTRRLAIELHEIRQLALGHATNPQFGNSSVDGEGLSFRDGDGNEIGRIGGGGNGMEVEYTYGPKPLMPSTPIVTADANLLLVQWDGQWAGGNEDGDAVADPDLASQAGLDRVEVHVSMEPTFVPDPILSFAGVLPVTPEGGAHTVGPLAEAGDYYVVLMARGKDGQYSAPSQRVHVVTTVGLMENELFDLALRADEARASADGKNTVHYGEEPVAPEGGFSEGDLWFDTTEDPETGFRKNTPHLWDPAANNGEGGWVSAADSRVDAIRDAQDALRGDVEQIVTDGAGATTYWLPAKPNEMTDPPPREGDLWFDTSESGGNKLHRFTGGVWASAADQRTAALQDALGDFEGTVEQRFTDADTAIDGLQASLTNLDETTLPGLRQDLSDAEGRLGEAEGQITDAFGQLDAVPGQISDAQQAAINAAAQDAESKANAAQQAAQEHADLVAQGAEDDAIAAAETRAQELADAAQQAAEGAAQVKADAARDAAIADAEGKIGVARQEAIDAALSEIENVEGNLVSSIDKKVNWSLSDPPVVFDGPADATWFKLSSFGSGGQVTSQWRWNGAVWVSTIMSESVLAKINIGTGTFGSMSGSRLDVGSVLADRVLVGAGRSVIPWSQVLSGATASPHVNRNSSSTGTLTIGEMDVSKGVPRHLVHNRTAPGAGVAGYIIEMRRGPFVSGDSSATRFAVSGGTWVFHGLAYTDVPNLDGRLEMVWYKADQSYGGQVNGATVRLGSAPTKLSVVGDFPQSAAYVIPFIWTNQPGETHWVGVELSQAVGGTLIEPGGIQTPHLAADVLEVGNLKAGTGQIAELVSRKIAAATGQFLKLDVGQLTVTQQSRLADVVAERVAADTAQFMELEVGKLVASEGVLDEAVIKQLFAEVVVSQMSFAESFIGGNAILEGAITAESGIIGSIDAGKITVGELDGARIKAKSVQADSVIVNGSVGTTLIKGGAITTEKIAVGAITAESGIIGSLDAGVITTGELRGELIRAQSIAGEKLAVDAIDGKTITGATVRTSSAGARVEMNSTGLFVKNSLGGNTVSMTNGTLTMLGGTITGGTIRTQVSGARVQLDATGLKAWNPSNEETFSVDANTGMVESRGALYTGAPGTVRAVLAPGVFDNVTITDPSDGSAAPAAGAGMLLGDDPARGSQIFHAKSTVFGKEFDSLTILGPSASSGRESIVFARGIINTTAVNTSGSMYSQIRTQNYSSYMFTRSIGVSTEVGASQSRAFLYANTGGTRVASVSVGNADARPQDSVEIKADGGIVLESGGDLTVRANGSKALDLRSDSTSAFFQSDTIYHRTYSAAANLYITGSRVVGRTTSARRYKLDEAVVEASEFEDALLSIPFKSWVDKEQRRLHDDLVEFRAENPMCPPPEHLQEAPDELPRHIGAVAEDFVDAGLDSFVTYDQYRRVDGLQYDRIGPALIPVVRRLRDRVNELERMMGEMANA